MAENKANASIQQYEPPRIPAGWDAQGKQFAQQVMDVFDDIYRRFGRLGPKDLTPSLRQEIGEIDGMHTAFEQLPETIKATVNDAGVETTSAKLDKDGVAINAQGNFTVAAGGFVGVDAVNAADSYINLGETFSANAQTGVQARQAMFRTLFVGGAELKPEDIIPLKVAAERPEGNGFLWLKPTASPGESKETKHSAAIANRGTNEMLSAGAVRTHDLTGAGAQADGAIEYRYSVSFFVINVGAAPVENARIAASITDGGSTVQLGSADTGRLPQWATAKLTFEAASTVNVCGGNTVSLVTTAEAGGSGFLYIERDQTISLTSRSTFSGGTDALPCEVTWIP